MGSLPPSANTTASNNTSHNLPAEAMPLISSSALLSTHLTQSSPTRPSTGRSPLQANKIQLTTNSLTHTHGSSLVRIGGTTVVCGVRAEILEVKDIPSWSVKDAVSRVVGEWEAAETGTSTPQTSQPTDDDDDQVDTALSTYNLLVPNLSLDTGCSPLHPANSAPSPEQMSVTQRLLSLLLTSRLVRARDLEIYSSTPSILTAGEADAEAEEQDEESMALDNDEPAQPPFAESDSGAGKEIKAYYTLYIDLLTLSYASSTSQLFDTAWLALLAALKTTTLPYAEWDRDEARVLCSSDMARAKKLKLRAMPVGMGFGVCELDRRVLEARRRKNDEADEPAERVLLVDLEGMEEECCAERGCVVVDCSRGGETDLVRVEKSGGGFVGVEELRTVVGVAEERWREWNGLLEGC